MKHQYIGLFWEKLLIQDRSIVEAVPFRLVQVLQQEQKVIISSDWRPSPLFIITLKDWKYMGMIKEKLLEIKRLRSAEAASPSMKPAIANI